MADLQTILKSKIEIDGLKKVTLNTPSNGDVLTYDSTAQEWQNAPAAAPVNALNDLTDVTITTPSTGNVLKYDGSKWINDTPVAELALGETSSTAYRGDRGKTAYDHSQLTSGNPHSVSKSDIGLSNVTNDAQLKASQLDTNTSLGSDDTKVPSQKAVKAYVDTEIGNIPAPSGGGNSVSITTGAALSAGDIVAIDANGAAVQANATDSALPAIGYVDDAYASAATAKVLLSGIVTGLTGLTGGDDVYLDVTAGKVVQTAPDQAGNIIQRLGIALSATSMLFDKGEAVEI